MEHDREELPVWEIEAEAIPKLLYVLREKIIQHFKEGGRVKILNADGLPPQELLPDFTFINWKD